MPPVTTATRSSSTSPRAHVSWQLTLERARSSEKGPSTRTQDPRARLFVSPPCGAFRPESFISRNPSHASGNGRTSHEMRPSRCAHEQIRLSRTHDVLDHPARHSMHLTSLCAFSASPIAVCTSEEYLDYRSEHLGAHDLQTKRQTLREGGTQNHGTP